MKRILLASTAIVAFAGAASAEVTLSGNSTLGYNDTNNGIDDDNLGFYADLEVTISLSQELDNGLTASASIDFEDLAGGEGSGEDDDDTDDIAGVSVIDYTLALESDIASLYYGDTSFAAESKWSGAGDMEADRFSEADGEETLRGEVAFGDVAVAVSYALSNSEGTRVEEVRDGELDQLSVGFTADLDIVSVILAYQEGSEVAPDSHNDGNGDFNEGEAYGVAVSASVAGADITVAYAYTDDDQGDQNAAFDLSGDPADESEEQSSLGIQVAYPFGPVTATVYYVSEDDPKNDEDNYGLNVTYSEGPLTVGLDYDNDQGTQIVELEGSYELPIGLTIYAGVITQDDIDNRQYIGGEYDLGAGASLLVSYAADDDNEDEDEIGAREYQEGVTVELSVAF